jgi:dTDP-4-dehydrorhamnose reductase
MKILVTGRNGQVGYELVRSLQPLGEVIGVDRGAMDLADLDQVRDVIRKIKPDLIVNSAAYTAVDKAESEPELAMRVNGLAPGIMAEEAARFGARLVHYSTDYVFDGTKQQPYGETDMPCPINMYGESKLAGEQAIAATGVSHLIFRTSWVYGMRGKNFLLTMMRLAAERDTLRIVADQHGAPTWSRTIADVTASILNQCRGVEDVDDWWRQHGGLYHLTAQGSTSWLGFADALLDAAPAKPELVPIGSDDYPVAAKRPANSRLACALLMSKFCQLPDWRDALQLCQER